MACEFLPSDRKFDDYGHSLLVQIRILFKIVLSEKSVLLKNCLLVNDFGGQFFVFLLKMF